MELTVEPAAPSYFEHRSHSSDIWQTSGRTAILAEFHRSIPIEVPYSPGCAVLTGALTRLESSAAPAMRRRLVDSFCAMMSHGRSHAAMFTDTSVIEGGLL